MTIKEIVKQWLEEHGYDGLFDNGDCGCLKDDLMPCGQPSEYCEAGHKIAVTGGKEPITQHRLKIRLFGDGGEWMVNEGKHMIPTPKSPHSRRD